MKKIFHPLSVLLPAILALACQAAPHSNESLELARSTENSVEVTISLHRDDFNSMTLSATFTPLDPSLHLYSKDIPKTGIEGLGRPTLLEIEKDSSMEAAGDVTESLPAQLPDSAPLELLVYPAGPVTLSLPIRLLDASSHTESILVTYMACNQQGCRAPVEQKVIEINIPKQ